MERNHIKTTILLILWMFCVSSCSTEKGGNSDAVDVNVDPSQTDGVLEVPLHDEMGNEIDTVFPEPTASEVADSIPEMDKFLLLDKEPYPLNLDELKQQIGYPKGTKENEREGKVVFKVLLDRQGRYHRHVVLSESNGVFTQAIASKIKGLRCAPGYRNGKPVWCWITIPFLFQLVK